MSAIEVSDIELPETAWVVGLSQLPAMGPVRLGALLRRWTPEQAWAQVVGGKVHQDKLVVSNARSLGMELSRRWQRAAALVDVAALWEAHGAAGVKVLRVSDRSFPSELVNDPDPPAVLFFRGNLEALNAPRVAIVGTRRCTHAGRAIAHELAMTLAGAGVCVLSGLALGIDAAAHQGALASLAIGGACPVGVVGTGLDVVYPRRHGELWEAVANSGLLISEYPMGTPPEPWRFPARNRILAAIADVVVVVESHAKGGSLHTVESALERDTTVMAVPGSVRSPASAGTNELLVAGCAPARDANDVLTALGLDAIAVGVRGQGRMPAIKLDATESKILDSFGWEPATLEQLVTRLGQAPGPVSVTLMKLKTAGLVTCRGSWWERR
ncbi:MAG: DNA-processing protein DprA [Acidimicrobiales bacterium]